MLADAMLQLWRFVAGAEKLPATMHMRRLP